MIKSIKAVDEMSYLVMEIETSYKNTVEYKISYNELIDRILFTAISEIVNIPTAIVNFFNDVDRKITGTNSYDSQFILNEAAIELNEKFKKRFLN